MADGGGRVTVRRIEALTLDGVAPGPVADWLPRFQTVSPYALLVDETYQRRLTDRSTRLIAKIVGGWDWAKFKPPIVAETPAGFEVIDGQHTAIAAASHPAIHEIPVMIVEAPETAGRAGAFIGHNRDRLPITPVRMHRAALAAGDPTAVKVQALADAAGVTLPRDNRSSADWRVNDCMAFDTLYRLLQRRRGGGLARILAVVSAAKARPIKAFYLAAADELLFGRDYREACDDARLAAAFDELGQVLPREAALFAATHRLPLWRAAAVVVFRNAHKGRRRVV